MAAFIFIVGSFLLSGHAQLPTAISLSKLVDAHYNHLKSLRARYTERYQGMGMDRTETGTLLLRKPGKMRWAYDRPEGKLFVLDGHDAISYTPGDAQAQRIPAKQLDDVRSPLRFLLGHTALAKELNGLVLTSKGANYTLSGVPKGGSQQIRSLSVTADAAGQIHALRIEETDGASTSFDFADMKENVSTQDGDFVFKAPPGVSIVNGTAPI